MAAAVVAAVAAGLAVVEAEEEGTGVGEVAGCQGAAVAVAGAAAVVA